jgi:hypothetical protein
VSWANLHRTLGFVAMAAGVLAAAGSHAADSAASGTARIGVNYRF